MDNYQIKKLKYYSSIIHCVLSAFITIVVLSFTFGVEDEYIYLLLLCTTFGWFWGGQFSGWYAPIPNAKGLIEPYVATLIITLFTATSAWIVFLLAQRIITWNFLFNDLLHDMLSGFLLGLYGFVITLPMTIVIGILLGFMLYRSQRQ